MPDLVELTEELQFSTAEYFETFRADRIKRRIISIVHLVLSVSAFVACYIWQKDLLSTVIFYSLGFIIVHSITQKIPNIGFYKPGYREEWHGDYCHCIPDENHVAFYGFGSIGFEVLIEMVCYGVIAALLWAFLPNLLSYAVILGAIIVMAFKCIIFPTVCDLVNIISKKNHALSLDLVNTIVTYGCIGITLLSLIGSCILFPFISPKSLDVNEAVESYYAEHAAKTNAFGGADLNEGEKDFKFFGMKCIVKQEGDFDLKNGMVKKGRSQIQLEYMLTHWEAKQISSQFDSLVVNSPVSFTSEEVVELSDYNDLAVISVTINEFDGTDGTGILTVTDKASGKTVYSSNFTITPTGGIWSSEYDMDMKLDNPIQFIYFGFGSLDLTWNVSEDKMELETFGEELKYTDNK